MQSLTSPNTELKAHSPPKTDHFTMVAETGVFITRQIDPPVPPNGPAEELKQEG